MTHRSVILILFAILAALLLAACLGEPALPELEAEPAPIRAAPAVDPTMAAVARLSLNLTGQPLVSEHIIPQIRHDLVGRSDCLMCHKQGVSGAPRIPDTHRGLESGTCQTCHTAPASAELSGEEMYTRVCARCHGANGEGSVGPALNSKEYLLSATEEDTRAAILQGRGTAEMLAWGDLGLLTERQVDELVEMIRAWEPTAPETSGSAAADPANAAHGDLEDGESLFAQFCSGCHGFNGETAVGDEFILREAVVELDDSTIAGGIRDGGQGMPPFHALLTTDDINDLLALVRAWQAGPVPTPTPIALSGEDVFARVCARCHGRNGEGGIGPPLNSKEFLTANDDETISQWIERGTLGTSMLSWGDLSLLSVEQIDELVAFIRAWEPTAPTTTGGATAALPSSAEAGDAAHGQQLFAQLCSGCHGLEGERQTRSTILNSEEFLDSLNDEMIASQILNGGREMPSFHAILTSQDVNDLLAFMRSGFSSVVAIVEAVAVTNFSAEVLPIFAEKCAICHGAAGGWSAATYDEVMNSGENAPVVIPGNPEESLLVQKLLGTQTTGGPMPPGGLLPEAEIDLIVRWVAAGALEE